MIIQNQVFTNKELSKAVKELDEVFVTIKNINKKFFGDDSVKDEVRESIHTMQKELLEEIGNNIVFSNEGEAS